jgi:hypothetical protein
VFLIFRTVYFIFSIVCFYFPYGAFLFSTCCVFVFLMSVYSSNIILEGQPTHRVHALARVPRWGWQWGYAPLTPDRPAKGAGSVKDQRQKGNEEENSACRQSPSAHAR